MGRPKVYIANKVPYEVEEYIGKHCDYEKWDKDEEVGKDELFNKISDKNGVLLAGIKVDEEFIDAAPKLKVVSNATVGYNNFNLDAMKSRNIIGTNTPNVLNNTVADLIFGLILASARRITEMDKYVKDGNWKAPADNSLFGVDVHNSTLGIIGMGRIGEVVAKRAKLGFDMDVIYYNRNRKLEIEEELGIEYSDFEDLLKKSDFILLMTPLNNETYHLIDSKEFNMMKTTSIFINASRGSTVNEKALIEALQNKKILGAGLDVYESEPIEIDNLLLKMDNVVTLPHLGSATERTRSQMAMLAAENLVKGVLGEVPPNAVPELIK
ncbi:2-hydroxyacid dehydrogenase [Clostridium hydrogeniformans]|uniref:2-hydroxyacid dehydrogenase n=1 Tax=Clostridium hydrogeniformans TaxID=349933 RepID=UPI0004808871|nr:D-glycerate dehydrogenase [Clostridium hydrogeniformans]